MLWTLFFLTWALQIVCILFILVYVKKLIGNILEYLEYLEFMGKVGIDD